MKKIGLMMGGLMLMATPAQAIPGQTLDEAAVWMQSNSTVRPSPNEKFLVRRINTAAQQMTFHASVMPPGKLARLAPRGRIIRSEMLSLFDMRNGVTLNRLRESVRSIYGLEIARDFEQAELVKNYPTEDRIQEAVIKQNTQLAAQQGELRRGERFAYWIEVAQTENGKAYSGQLTVFLLDDLEKLRSELANR
ncbi:hypothetical protein [Leptolyngbya sp. NIES-2104]|uniref:hypothetical protein n=1 Tax=Leptolyngbya sp. NIES-2104 TaxID=1552121 RepID=UPI0006EC9166|nr:hypothetical protein [Leptolyngbya sp. NIES-2104]GAP98409.1 hypothetical protein NIES2104_49640 [Leptolyngbya sp. NIES-2104]